MAVLMPEQIVKYVRDAGITNPDAISTAVAIAYAESSGNTHAHNPKPPDNSYGLWQINMLGNMGPDRRAKLGITRNEQLFDPTINAKAMAMISNGGTNWGPWSTYSSGEYRTYYDRNRDKLREILGDINITTPIVTGVQSITDIFGGIGSAVGGLGESFAGLPKVFDLILKLANPTTWIRTFAALAGVVFIIIGIVLLAREAR